MNTPITRSESAGGLIIGPDGRYLIVSQHGTSWSLPKGTLEPGEDLITTAYREIYEETGLSTVTLVRPLGSYDRHRISKDGGDDTSVLKTIHMFLFTTTQSDLMPHDAENPEARWVTRDEALSLLTHPKDREFFEQATRSI